jgi:acetoin:2,6-dichlorophenolindophenol oxidoreductase subunit alpha
MLNLNKQKAENMYRQMVTIRCFEETVASLMDQGKLVGEAHVYIGQEASGVGVCAALNDDDYITSTHRGHGHVIAKGADIRRMMAELYGRSTGYCKGKGGSMHVADVSLGILGANGIVGGGISIATGAALAAQVKGDGRVAACFFGDGASNEGSFHESLNLASVWKLPVIFVCENNKFQEFSPSAPLIAGSVHERAQAYKIPGVLVDGQDVIAVYTAAFQAVERARSGLGPTLIETDTYRFGGHFIGEEKMVPSYRPDDELASWQLRDPLSVYQSWLIDNKMFSEKEIASINAQVDLEIQEAVLFAEQSPWPSPEEALQDLFA